MKKSYKLITTAFFAASSMLAQQGQIIPCHTDEATKQYFLAHPEEKARYEKEMAEATLSPEYMNQLNARKAGGNNSVYNQTSWALDTIPVVFHILHQGGSENVSDATINQALVEVNRVHTKTIPDTAQIDPLFKGISGANNFVFQLATKDPNGNCTNGILHHYDSNTNWSQTSPNYAYTWDRTKYLNVYIVKEICNGTAPCSQSGGIIVGYTYLPGAVPAAYDVVIYNYQFLTGTNARSMAHEFGHWLGLSHTFGNTNSPGTCVNTGSIASQSDDNLAGAAPAVACVGVTDDTPKYAGAFSTCPSSSVNTCDASGTANVQNIMDYSSCPKNFTWGQIQRMHNMMNSTTASRKNVISAANKIATGVRNPQVCVPTPYFHASTTLLCAGSTVTFSDSSGNATVTSFNWDFPGGTLASGSTLTSASPHVIYNAPGLYTVSYTASTTAGGASITKTSYINVITSVAAYNTNYTESFETSTVPGPDWTTYSTAGVDWAVASNAGATGTKSIMLSNVSNIPGDTSTFVSNTFNLAAIGSPILTFKMAYQQQATTNTDKLQVYSSTDCGGTWTARFTRSGTSLQPTTVSGTSSTPFTPQSSQFSTYTVVISALASTTNGMFKFVFYAGTASTGNNIYIDDINVRNSTSGIQSIEDKVSLVIYPNPSSSTVNISFALAEKQNIAINVVDMLGRVVETIPTQQYASGENMVTLGNKSTYQSGVYFVNINVDGQQISKKIIIE